MVFWGQAGPEVYRRPLDGLGVDETVTWLREWARRFLRPGQQLTTPVAVEDARGGVLLRFLTRATGYADFDVSESKEEKWANAKPGVAESKAGKPDGALLLIAESGACHSDDAECRVRHPPSAPPALCRNRSASQSRVPGNALGRGPIGSYG